MSQNCSTEKNLRNCFATRMQLQEPVINMSTFSWE
jgi:hypothetical protein